MVKRTIEMMERQMKHLVRLVDDLLDISRITRGKAPLRHETLDLKHILYDALESSWAPDDSRRITLSVELTDQPVAVQGDRDRLTQVFSNILLNAAKYTADDGRVWLSLRCEDSEAVVSVRDTGVGIPAESLETIFEMFSQLRPPGHGEGGLGIGLALVRQLVKLHGGRVEARSEGLGHGSEFIVHLPLHDAGTQPLLPADSQRTASAAVRRVLVVDDNSDCAHTLITLLGLLGHQAREAGDGLQALEEVRTFQPDVIFMDIGMPRMDGLEAARQIRAMPLAEQPLIVALTGWGQQSDRARSQEAGIDQHLIKPIDPEALRRIFDSLQPSAAT